MLVFDLASGHEPCCAVVDCRCWSAFLATLGWAGGSISDGVGIGMQCCINEWLGGVVEGRLFCVTSMNALVRLLIDWLSCCDC